ncbi:MAG: alpha-mannosidase [Firmicutes bacterium]|nr:alpha-mannosidase [Bacillota bacterium]
MSTGDLSVAKSMYFTGEKIQGRVAELGSFIYSARRPVTNLRCIEGDPEGASRVGYDDSAWDSFEIGSRWGGRDVTMWFRGEVEIPPEWAYSEFEGESGGFDSPNGNGYRPGDDGVRHEDERRRRDDGGRRLLALHLRLFSGENAHLSGPEGLLYINGRPICGIDRNHTEVILTPAMVNTMAGGTGADVTTGANATMVTTATTAATVATATTVTAGTAGTTATGGATDEAAPRLVIAIKATSGMQEAEHVFEAAELVLIDRDADSLYYSLKAGIEAVGVLGPDSPDGIALLNILDDAVGYIDWREPGSDAFYESIREARRRLDSAMARLPRGGIKPRVTCVGHSHIDVAWLWPLRHTREKCSRTFSTATHLMELYPEYCFIQSQPQLYKFIKEDHPEIYARIREKVASGQWEPEGGMWVEADCNVTSGESLVRQLLFGTRFFRQEFGRECKVLWLPDVFGYSWALPQIIKKSGLEYFMTTKISWNQYNRPEYDTFMWRGMDGTEVLTHFITTPHGGDENWWFFTYNGEITPATLKGIWDNYRQKEINDELLLSFGFGDGGGGPTRTMLEMARRLKDVPGIPRAEVGKAEPFFERLAEKVKDHPRLPVWDGELYLEYHRGTYTSQAHNKRANRLSEILYHDAEGFSCLAKAFGRGFIYPQEDINRGWELILLNQFHDILPGSSIREVYEDCARDYEEVAMLANRVLEGALGHLVANMSLKKREAIVVFNSLSWERSDVVIVPWDPAFEGKRFVDAGGRPVASQVVEAQKELLLYVENVPAFGYKAVYLEEGEPVGLNGGESEPLASGEISIAPARLENRFFIISLNPAGQITSIWDKLKGREVLAPGARANIIQVFEDKPLRHDAWDIDIFYRDKMWEVTDLVEATVEEAGPERGVLKLVWRFMNSIITQRLAIYRAIPRVDFRTEVDWRERQLLLKVAFPVDVRSTKATYEIQFGNVERPTHWNTSWDYARFETCGHKWADLSEGGYGVSLLNDCKYGHDIKDNVMRLTLIKSAIAPDPLADKCHHTFTYSLYPHPGDWYQGGTVREGYSLNYPLRGVAVLNGNQSGEGQGESDNLLPDSFSFIRVDAPNVIVETVKKAEDGEATVVRVYEYGNRRGPVTLSFGFPIKAARECNLMEREEAPVEFSGNKLKFFIKPYEIRTFMVECGVVI